ncbi:MAG: SDR family oxidoreductase [Paracoccaceae bacterium]
MKVLIVGAGIVGASIAWHLARGGAEVTVLEAERPAAGASGRSFGWINASFFLNDDHFRLRAEGLRAWRRLAAAVPAAAPAWTGALWFESAGAELAAMHQRLRRLGYPVRRLAGAAAVSAAEPGLRAPPAQALLFPDEGALDAAEATRALLAASGARVLAGTPARGLIETGGRVIGARTPMGPLPADHVVIAAGTGSPALLAPLGLALPMLPRPGLILRTAPVGFGLSRILVAPTLEVRQLPDGSLIAPCAAGHQSDSADRVPDEGAASEATLTRLRALLGGGGRAGANAAGPPAGAGRWLAGDRAGAAGAFRRGDAFGRDAGSPGGRGSGGRDIGARHGGIGRHRHRQVSTGGEGMSGVAGRVALVTGAGAADGIGFATARLLKAAGARVAISATTDRVFTRLQELGPEGSFAATADLTDPAQVAGLVEAASRALGPIDILVNNAGMSQSGVSFPRRTLAEVTDEAFDFQIAISLKSAFMVSRAVLPAMMARGFGRIVHVSSVTGPLVGIAGSGPYAAAKAGLLGMARVQAIECGPHGVTVNCIGPGWIHTGSSSPEEVTAGRYTPVGRAGRPEEIGHVAVFLASEEASYLTGQLITVDGGNTLQEFKVGLPE